MFKKENHLFNCFCVSACTGLLGLLAYYKLDKTYGKILFVLMVVFNVFLSLKTIAFSPAAVVVGGLFLAALVGLLGVLIGHLSGVTSWLNKEVENE